jgi:hypothetical protein
MVRAAKGSDTVRRATLAELAAAYRAGEPVTLAAVFDAAGLTEQERLVITAGWDRALADIARDLPDLRPHKRRTGLPMTRQRVHQLDKQARAKLGLPSRSAMQQADRNDRAEALDVGKAGIAEWDLHNTEHVHRVTAREHRERRRERRLDELTAAYIREAEAGGMSRARRAYYAACFAG